MWLKRREKMKNEILSIVVPCYNEQEVLPSTNERLLTLLSDMSASGLVSAQSRIVYVDDGSRDATWSLIHDPSAEGIADLVHAPTSSVRPSAPQLSADARCWRPDVLPYPSNCPYMSACYHIAS